MNLINVSTYGVEVAPYQASPNVNGVFGVWAENTASGSLNVSSLTINGTSITSLPGSGSAMKATNPAARPCRILPLTSSTTPRPPFPI